MMKPILTFFTTLSCVLMLSTVQGQFRSNESVDSSDLNNSSLFNSTENQSTDVVDNSTDEIIFFEDPIDNLEVEGPNDLFEDAPIDSYYHILLFAGLTVGTLFSYKKIFK